MEKGNDLKIINEYKWKITIKTIFLIIIWIY